MERKEKIAKELKKHMVAIVDEDTEEILYEQTVEETLSGMEFCIDVIDGEICMVEDENDYRKIGDTVRECLETLFSCTKNGSYFNYEDELEEDDENYEEGEENIQRSYCDFVMYCK